MSIIYSHDYSETLNGTLSDDIIYGYGGNDTIDGVTGNEPDVVDGAVAASLVNTDSLSRGAQSAIFEKRSAGKGWKSTYRQME